MKEASVRKLMASTRCAVCGQRYKVSDINVLGHQEDLWFLRVQCSACDTQFLVAAAIRKEKAPEIISDLTGVELGKFRNAKPLTGDDVLDMHNFLKSFDGNFVRLFDKGRKRRGK